MELLRLQVLVCSGEECAKSQKLGLYNIFKTEIRKNNLEYEVELIKTKCLGLCDLGPVVIVYPGDIVYCNIKKDDVPEIVRQHFLKDKVVDRLIYKEEKTRLLSLDQLELFKRQKRIALKNCGKINPENIEEYIAFDGYFALSKVLNERTREDVVGIIEESGLRGRGGGGFKTGLKWRLASEEESNQKYVICNADEGDPGAFMDRSILEGDPHSVIEAMAICGFAIGASKGFIYVRAEYPLAVERLKLAIAQAYEKGVLGENIFEKGFDFDIEIRLGAGAFVCGEETALMQSIEGKRGMPMPKPPFPIKSGLWGKPTVINNVETLSSIPQIILNGPSWFKSIGTLESPGTKVFALGGKISNPGLIEIPMGTTLEEIIYEIGGGIPNGKAFKAVQTGGPSGGCIPKENLDTPIEYETLRELGSMMGSGGMIVMDEDNCMVDVARFFLDFTKDESCGKCPPCRIGTKRLLEILERLTLGHGEDGDIEKLEHLGEGIKKTALCGLGQTAPNPVLSTLRHFKDEYENHIYEKKCTSKSCRALFVYDILEEKCTGCGICERNCIVGAISGKIGEVHIIDPLKCVRCGLCEQVCKFKAVVKV